MTRNSNRLELTWIGKENRPKLEPRILIEDPALSYHAPRRVSEEDSFDNRLIFGDNLLALKALEQEFAGKVKCIYIDPPYNTGSAFEHYDDGVEHSLWLALMRDRLEILRRLLAPDGSLWVTLDDNECHYAKVLLDEVFGRQNFVATVVWQKVYTVKNTARQFSAMHDYLLVYASNGELWTPNALDRTDEQDQAYRNLDDDPRGPWKATPLHARNPYSAGRYTIVSPSGRSISPPTGTYWRVSKERYEELLGDNRIWWGKGGDGVPAQKRFLDEVKVGVTPSTLWMHSEAGHNAEAKNELRRLLPGEVDLFLTPKPERLIRRVLQTATTRGDLVLDSFAGSGTTGAVAHKMGRRWIMVELEDTCHTHIIPRLRKVIDGTDPGGVTEAVGWKGGGGFRYFRLAPSLLERDRFGNWVISKEFNAAMLAEAVCKLESFAYAPSEEVYWQQGHSTETDFIYVTTQTLTHEMLAQLSEDVGEGRSLLVCCSAFRSSANAFPNLTLKKIPKAVLKKCEWGHDDYSLEIENLPKAKPGEEKTDGGAMKSLFDEGSDR
jgi:adenine-specific DNA-methyltransferase